MARTAKKPITDTLPAAPELPRYSTRAQFAEIHARLYTPISPRTLETWPIAWRTVNGRAVAETQVLLAEAERRFNAAPVIMGGRKSQTVA